MHVPYDTYLIEGKDLAYKARDVGKRINIDHCARTLGDRWEHIAVVPGIGPVIDTIHGGSIDRISENIQTS